MKVQHALLRLFTFFFPCHLCNVLFRRVLCLLCVVLLCLNAPFVYVLLKMCLIVLYINDFFILLCYFDLCYKILIDSMLPYFIDTVVIQIKDIIESNRLFHWRQINISLIQLNFFLSVHHNSRFQTFFQISQFLFRLKQSFVTLNFGKWICIYTIFFPIKKLGDSSILKSFWCQ